MKAYWGVEVYLHSFFDIGIDGGEWSASRSDRFTPRERAPGTHWIGGWVGLLVCMVLLPDCTISCCSAGSSLMLTFHMPHCSKMWNWWNIVTVVSGTHRPICHPSNNCSRRNEGVSKSFRTGCLERELQMVQLSATRCSCISILWVSLVSFTAITLCFASQRVFIVDVVYFVMTQSGNFWIHLHRPCSFSLN
jgi:hypothetical protein